MDQRSGHANGQARARVHRQPTVRVIHRPRPGHVRKWTSSLTMKPSHRSGGISEGRKCERASTEAIPGERDARRSLWCGHRRRPPSGSEGSRRRWSSSPRSLFDAHGGARRRFRLTHPPVLAAPASSGRFGPSRRSHLQGAADEVGIVDEVMSATLSDPGAGPLPSGVERATSERSAKALAWTRGYLAGRPGRYPAPS